MAWESRSSPKYFAKAFVMPDWTIEGEIVFTRIPLGPRKSARDLEIPATAALDCKTGECSRQFTSRMGSKRNRKGDVQDRSKVYERRVREQQRSKS